MAGRKPRATRDEQAGTNPLQGGKPGIVNPNASHAPEAQSSRSRANSNGLKHGMASARALNDRAEAIIAAQLEDARCPDHLRSPTFAAEVMAWGKAEAMASLAWDYMCELLEAGGPAAIFGMQPGMLKAQSEVWKAHAAHAASRRAALGISPVSYAKIARDLGLAAATTQDQLARMSERGGEIASRRLGIVRAAE